LNINSVTLSGNLTKDPEMKNVGDTSVTKLRLAVNKRVKENGEWADKPMYFDVDAWGRQGEIVAQYCTRGSHLTISGRLDWREWESDDGSKRQAVSIVAAVIELPSKREAEQARGGGVAAGSATNAPSGSDFVKQNATNPTDFAGDDDIPF
jgi:single-strand DNA-binding protein